MSVLFEERSSSLERRWKAAWSALERNMSVLKLFYISFIFILNAYKNVCSEVCFSHGWFLWCVLGMFFASHLASGLLTSSLWIVFLLEVGWRLRENWLFALIQMIFPSLETSSWLVLILHLPFLEEAAVLEEWREDRQLNFTCSLSLYVFFSLDEAWPGLRCAFA